MERIIITAREFDIQPEQVQEAVRNLVQAADLQLQQVWRLEQEDSADPYMWLVTYYPLGSDGKRIRELDDKGNLIGAVKAFKRVYGMVEMPGVVNIQERK